MKPTEVIRRPLVTEKTTIAREAGRRSSCSRWRRDATKIDVRRAVEKLFGSKVASVRTQIMHGKIKRQGRFAGQRSDWKKAWVRLQGRREGAGVHRRRVDEGSIMPIRNYKPTSAGRRFQSVQTFDEITTSTAVQAADRDRSSDRAAATTAAS